MPRRGGQDSTREQLPVFFNIKFQEQPQPATALEFCRNGFVPQEQCQATANTAMATRIAVFLNPSRPRWAVKDIYKDRQQPQQVESLIDPKITRRIATGTREEEAKSTTVPRDKDDSFLGDQLSNSAIYMMGEYCVN